MVRDQRTLELERLIDPKIIRRASWTRRDLEIGEWRLELPRRSISATAIARNKLLEVRRNGSREFVGVILDRQLDRLGEVWTIGGPDLKDWLRRRVAGLAAADARSGAAETVAKGYVEDNLGPSADFVRRGSTELLEARTWTVEANSGRGETVSYSALRNWLDAVLVDVCRKGNVWHDVILAGSSEPADGYEYVIYEPVDATIGAGGTPFSVRFDNVGQLRYAEDYRRTTNYLYVLGDGEAGSRAYREVQDASSVASDFRREGMFDGRNATTDAQLDDLGAAEIARQLAASITVDAQPLITSPNAVYREDWDIGYDVTVSIPDVSVEVNRRVVAATVELAANAAAETIKMALGTYRADSTLRRIQDALEQARRSSLE